MITTYSTVDQNCHSISTSQKIPTKSYGPIVAVLAFATFGASFAIPTMEQSYQQPLISSQSSAMYAYNSGDITSYHLGDTTMKMQLKSSLERIEEIRNLKDNWNGYNATVFSENLINRIISIVSSLNIQPQIFPTAQSSIQLEYDKENGDYLEFEIFENTIKQFMLLADGTSFSSEAIQITDIKSQVDKFYG